MTKFTVWRDGDDIAVNVKNCETREVSRYIVHGKRECGIPKYFVFRY